MNTGIWTAVAIGVAGALALSGCAPVRDSALYMVDGVRMEVTRDRSIVDTSGVVLPESTQTPGTVLLGGPALGSGIVIRREDGVPVTEADRPRAQATFALYCAAMGRRAPEAGLSWDRADRPTAFFGMCAAQ